MASSSTDSDDSGNETATLISMTSGIKHIPDINEDYKNAQTRVLYGSIGAFTLSAPSIAAVVIAQKYDSSVCYSDNEEYTIALDTWLRIGGGVALAITIFYFFIGHMYLCMTAATRHKFDVRFMSFYLEHLCWHFFVSLFHYSWALIGVDMYANQMSEECQSDIVGSMVLGFSIANPLQICCAMCCRFSCIAQYKQVVLF